MTSSLTCAPFDFARQRPRGFFGIGFHLIDVAAVIADLGRFRGIYTVQTDFELGLFGCDDLDGIAVRYFGDCAGDGANDGLGSWGVDECR